MRRNFNCNDAFLIFVVVFLFFPLVSEMGNNKLQQNGNNFIGVWFGNYNFDVKFESQKLKRSRKASINNSTGRWCKMYFK